MRLRKSAAAFGLAGPAKAEVRMRGERVRSRAARMVLETSLVAAAIAGTTRGVKGPAETTSAAMRSGERSPDASKCHARNLVVKSLVVRTSAETSPVVRRLVAKSGETTRLATRSA